MKKFSKSLVLGISIMTLMSGIASAHSTSQLSWGDTTAEQRVGDYSEIIAPVNYKNVVKLSSNQAVWDKKEEKRNGDYSKITASVEYNSVIQSSYSSASLLPWERRAAERNGDYSKIEAPRN